ncbi:RNA polymerase sigma factor [Noviherbaspirillum saxi]|uniref:RNA polymerase sigma factor n=1 Tax=Noviherbaspirillum saxi TaxID=2320863 RepID=A0A3A3FI86_9BURK|nr:RNA polymerase sigma factor [Noviherbaspirillum saxi]RJF95218.1 RNA polymerase sigma factor [Noviherbaspirillum saxi]
MQDDIAQLMVSCIPRLRRYARALAGDRSGADDLVQDTMERGWSKLSSWRAGSDMRAWLFGIMHNLHIDQVRKPTLAMVELDDDTPVPLVNATQTHRLEIRDMQSALQTLPAELREVLLLVALEEMSYEEVAVTLRIPLGTVMSRLSRARERLRAHMEGRAITSPLKVVK